MLHLRRVSALIRVSSLWPPTECWWPQGNGGAHGLTGWEQRWGADFHGVLAADWKAGGQTGRLHSVEFAAFLSAVALSRLCNVNQPNLSRQSVSSMPNRCNFLVNHLLNLGNFKLKASLSSALSHQTLSPVSHSPHYMMSNRPYSNVLQPWFRGL